MRTSGVLNKFVNKRPGHAKCWEEVKRKGDDAIKKWIDDEMTGRTCAIVLVGAQTASRKWVTYEISGKAVNDRGDARHSN